jgi:hypothetical protein
MEFELNLQYSARLGEFLGVHAFLRFRAAHMQDNPDHQCLLANACLQMLVCPSPVFASLLLSRELRKLFLLHVASLQLIMDLVLL